MINKKILLPILTLLLIFSCDKETKVEVPPVFKRDYATQYNEDIAKIENYLKTHSVVITNNSGFPDDQDASFSIVPNLDVNSIWGSNPAIPKASLLFKLATINGVVHKIYYIKFREGVGVSPMVTGRAKFFYKGFLLDDSVFDTSSVTGFTANLNQLIFGFREILPLFKMGTVTGVNQYADFGAGVMFLPSAFAYYDNPAGTIPAYSPIVFNFKLFEVF